MGMGICGIQGSYGHVGRSASAMGNLFTQIGMEGYGH